MSAEPCIKKRFESERQAKQAHANASYRIRAYRCEDCHGWHVTASEKRASGSVKHYGRGHRW